MGVLKLFVLIAVATVSLCEENISDQQFQEKPKMVLIETRFKRETENDSIIPGNKIHQKIPFALNKSSKIRGLKPATKPLRPLNIRSPHFVPGKIIVPISHLKSKASTNTIENKTYKHFDLSGLSNNTNIENGTKENETVISPILEKNGNTNLEIQECEKEDQAIEASNLETSMEIKDKSTTTVTEEIEKNNTEETKSPALNLVDENKCDHLSSKESELTNTMSTTDPILPIEEPSEIITSETENVEDVEEDNISYPEPVANDTSTNIINKDVKHSKGVEVDTIINLRKNTLPIFNGALKLLVPKGKQTGLPPMTVLKEKNPIHRILGLQKSNKQEDIIKVKNGPEVLSLFKPYQSEPAKEIVIQNNIFEELYEPTAPPQYLSPQVITSELRPTHNWNNFDTITSDFYNKYNVPTNYEEMNKPYSYEIRRYPGKYVVNTYDGYRNINDDKTLYTNDANKWNQGYNYYQPQATCFGQSPNFNTYHHGQASLRDRIWRYWRNNQIVIRPKTANGVNSERLFKSVIGLTNKLATPVYNRPANVFNSNACGNENISPYSHSNQFQLK